jgi:hypothetical protein
MDTDGWLIGEHIYIQEPTSEHNGWGIFLYPWGRRLTGDFSMKSDALEFAQELNELNIAWEQMQTIDRAPPQHRIFLREVLSLISALDRNRLRMLVREVVDIPRRKGRKSGKLPLPRPQKRSAENQDE